MSIAIVTGASSGLGQEFVRQIADREAVDEIWVIARRENRLGELVGNCRVSITPVVMDLAKKESIERLRRILQDAKPDVKILVNAAGFGKTGTYKDITLGNLSTIPLPPGLKALSVGHYMTAG